MPISNNLTNVIFFQNFVYQTYRGFLNQHAENILIRLISIYLFRLNGILGKVNFGNNFTFETLGRCDYVLVKIKTTRAMIACMHDTGHDGCNVFNKGLFYTNVAIVMIKL